MKPVVSVAEMRAIDAAAPEPTEVLVERAGAAVAAAVLDVVGGAYARRFAVVAGKGNNGADGRAAARRLRRRGAVVDVFDAADVPPVLRGYDLVVDAAYGTGFRGEYRAPDPCGAPVVSVDIPSGVFGDTGTAGPGAVTADFTVTFAALKPGLLLGDGPSHAGDIAVADIGLDVPDAAIQLVEDRDVAWWYPPRSREAHKWERAVLVVAGSAGMLGAAALTARGALRAGAGMVRLASPGATASTFPPDEIVGVPLPGEAWAGAVLAEADRFGAVVIGPGLGRDPTTAAQVREVVSEAPVPVVVDADGLNCLAGEDLGGLVGAREAATILTPHAGEFERLAGAAPGEDRVSAAVELAEKTGTVVLLKGSTTVVADSAGDVYLAACGDPRLATAGTGDVLSGVVGAFLSTGMLPELAAALAAHAHGAASRLGPTVGFAAGDLLELLPRWLDAVVASG